jgi:hypothetical protein
VLPRVGRLDTDHENVGFLREATDRSSKLHDRPLAVFSAAKIERARKTIALADERQDGLRLVKREPSI